MPSFCAPSLAKIEEEKACSGLWVGTVPKLEGGGPAQAQPSMWLLEGKWGLASQAQQLS